MAKILDFNDKGGASIDIPQFLDSDEKDTVMVEIPEFPHTSLIFFKEPSIQLIEIDQDIPLADSDEKREFLMKYKNVLAKYMSKNVDFGKTYWNCYKNKNTVSVNYNPHSIRISVSNYELRRSLAWYIQSHLESEITLQKDELEISHSSLRLCDKDLKERLLKTIRSSESILEAENKLIEFGFSEIQAKHILNMRLKTMNELSGERLKENIKLLEEMKSFLEELNK
jgi:hypothetical protein